MPEEYWTLDAKIYSKGSRKAFPASFYGDVDGKIKISNKEQADKILAELEDAEYQVVKVKKGTRRKSPRLRLSLLHYSRKPLVNWVFRPEEP